MLGSRRFTRPVNILARLRRGFGQANGDDQVAALVPRSSIMSVSILADTAMRSLRYALRSAGHRQITGGQNLVLVHVGPDGARSSDFATVQRVSRQAVSAVLHDLATLGYVRRRHDPAGGRVVVFVPTRYGRALLADYIAGIDVLEQAYTNVLGQHRFDDLTHCMRDLRHWFGLEHRFSLTSSNERLGSATSARRQAELDDLSQELLRWLGESDAWWLAEHPWRHVSARIAQAPGHVADESR